MRKSIFPNESMRSHDEHWLDLAKLAQVQVTSENDSHPVERALSGDDVSGWRAADPGQQTIRIVFDQPQTIRRVLLVFEEHDTARTQEFVLRCCPQVGEAFHDLVRQQWNFSPPGTVREREDYNLGPCTAHAVELVIVPDISTNAAIACLKQMRIA